ncbi:MAG: ATP-binding cassette domain-containing protein [Candidatus Micrarchaeia archaeon]
MSEYAIEVYDLVKKFNDLTAVDGITLKISKGEIFGLLGPNGAGKSTTINILLHLLEPTSGKALVDGYDILKHSKEVKKLIGLVPQETVVEPELTAEANLRLFGRLYELPEDEIEKKIDELLKLAELSEFRHKLAGTFSGGMQRRLAVVKALIHDPSILILDEPTVGLDVQNRTALWNLLKKINRERGVTILLTTQYLEEADMLCNRIAIIDHGKIKAMGTPAQLKQSISKGFMIEIFAEQKHIKDIMALIKHRFRLEASMSGDRITVNISANPVEFLSKVSSELEKEKIPIISISMHMPTLDDVFLKITGSSIRDTASNEVVSPTVRLRGR